MLAAALLLALGAPAAASTTNVGAGGADFLLLGAGARAYAMGGAFSAVAEGPDAIFWNPAGLTTLKTVEFSYTRAELLRTLHHDYYALALPAPPLGGSLGFSAGILTQDTLPVVTVTNQTIGSFRPHSEVFTAAYSRPFYTAGEIEPRPRDESAATWNMPGTARPRALFDDPWKATLSVGLAAKVLHEALYTVRAAAAAVDLGALWRPEKLGGMSFSGVVKNLGSREKFSGDARNLPLELDLGTAYDWRREERHRLVPSFDLALPYYGPPSARLGLEYTRSAGEDRVRWSWRVGYDTVSAGDLDPLAGLTGGIGIWVGRLSADFAYQPFDALGDIYRMSFGYRF